MSQAPIGDIWPELVLSEWQDTLATLHRWTQIAGKIRLAQTPWVNHSWHVTLYVTSRGLTTSPIPHGDGTFQIDFDFVDHELVVSANNGDTGRFELAPQTVATFYKRLMRILDDLALPVDISLRPNEFPDPVERLDRDETHSAYDAAYAHRFWQVLVQADRVFKCFRARFTGKCSPVHFFWGGADLAVTRFSGRKAPEHPGGIPNLPDWVTREAYSHEVSSCGFWPGGAGSEAAFYAYAYPTPAGFADAVIKPEAAFWSSEMGEFFLPYDIVRRTKNPDEMLLEFLQSTYEAAADLGKWDRASLEPPRGWTKT